MSQLIHAKSVQMNVSPDDTIDEWVIIMKFTGSARSALTVDLSNMGGSQTDMKRHCYDCQAM